MYNFLFPSFGRNAGAHPRPRSFFFCGWFVGSKVFSCVYCLLFPRAIGLGCGERVRDLMIRFISLLFAPKSCARRRERGEEWNRTIVLVVLVLIEFRICLIISGLMNRRRKMYESVCVCLCE